MAATPTAESVLTVLRQYHADRSTWPTLKELAEHTGWPVMSISACLGPLMERGRIKRHRDGTYQPIMAMAAHPVRTAEVLAPGHLPDEAPKAPAAAAVEKPQYTLVPLPDPRHKRYRDHFDYPPDEDFAVMAREAYETHPDDPCAEIRSRLGVADSLVLATGNIQDHIRAAFRRLGRERPLGERDKKKRKAVQAVLIESAAQAEPATQEVQAPQAEPPEAYPPEDQAPAHVCNCGGECGRCASLADEGPCAPENDPALAASEQAAKEPTQEPPPAPQPPMEWVDRLMSRPELTGGTPDATTPDLRRYMVEPLGGRVPSAADGVMEALASLGMATDKVLTLRKVLAALVAVDMPEETLRAVVERLVA